MALEILEDDAGKSYVEVVAIVPPDSGVTFPIGSPLPLNNHKAYFFAPKIIRGKAGKAIGAVLKNLLNLMKGNKAFVDLLDGNVEGALVDDAIFEKTEDLIAELAEASLAVNYKPETVVAILESGFVDMTHLYLIIAIVMGQTLNYEVRVKKNENELEIENET